MTAIATPGKRGGLLAPLVPSSGVGRDAAAVGQHIELVCLHLLEPLSLRYMVESAQAELDEVAKAAMVPNWDGYGARPIDVDAYWLARRFLAALPTTTPLPHVLVDPDGEIAISWNLDPSWVFSVSIGPTGRVSYAGLFGTSKVHGTEWFLEEIPDVVLDNLTRLFSAARGRTGSPAR